MIEISKREGDIVLALLRIAYSEGLGTDGDDDLALRIIIAWPELAEGMSYLFYNSVRGGRVHCPKCRGILKEYGTGGYNSWYGIENKDGFVCPYCGWRYPLVYHWGGGEFVSDDNPVPKWSVRR